MSSPTVTLFSLNGSHIVLIPKKSDTATPTVYRPINIVHEIQKIFSKILADQLQPHMKNLIHPTQTDFLK
jgi:hypothetical protein